MTHLHAQFVAATLLAMALPLAANAADPVPGKTVPRTQPVTAPGIATPPAAITAKPGLVVAHTRITKVEAPFKVLPGTALVVKVFGTGVETQCPTTVLIGKDGNQYFKKGAVQYGTGAWPRVSSFALEPGTYTVRISMTEGGPGTSQAEREACGSAGVPGDGTKVLVGDIPS